MTELIRFVLQRSLRLRFILDFSLLTMLCTAAGGQRLVINPRGNQVKTVNSGAIFTCTLHEFTDTAASLTSAAATAGDAAAATLALPEMSWQGPQMSYISSTRGRVYTEQTDPYNLRLYVTGVQESDAGQYTCTAKTATPAADAVNQTEQEGHRVLSDSVRLYLYEEIQFADTPILERHQLGSSALLQCVATGQPKPELSWRFNRQRVIPSGNGKYVYEEKGLRINKLDLRDSGTYECRAEVESHGNVKVRAVTLDILYPPVIMRNPVADLVVQGRNASLQCRADGNPPVYYEWFKEQKMSEVVRVKVRVAEGTDTFVIRDVDSDDEGRYFCRVTNTFGMKEVHVDVRMLATPKIKQSFPSRVLLPEGATLNVSCEASGIPVPKIFWGRAGETHDYTNDNQLSHLSRSGQLISQTHPGLATLIIQNVDRSMAGGLSCTAQNRVSQDVRNMTVIIEYKPTVAIAERDQLGWQGQLRNLTCTSVGVPSPTINWFHNEKFIVQNDTYVVTVLKSLETVTSVLTISIDDVDNWVYGAYTCIAKNVVASESDSVQLTEAVMPDAPRNVSVIDEQATSVTLSAVVPDNDGGMPVTSWQVQYEKLVAGNDATSGRRTTLTFTDESAMVVPDLSPGVTYMFFLSAGNAIGYGPAARFRVSTRHQLIDSPGGGSGGGGQVDYGGSEGGNRQRSEDAIIIERRPPVESEDDRTGGSVLFDGGPIFVVALGTGCAVVLISCILAVMCTFSRARRRHKKKCQGSSERQGSHRNQKSGPEDAVTSGGSLRRDADYNEFGSGGCGRVGSASSTAKIAEAERDDDDDCDEANSNCCAGGCCNHKDLHAATATDRRSVRHSSSSQSCASKASRSSSHHRLQQQQQRGAAIASSSTGEAGSERAGRDVKTGSGPSSQQQIPDNYNELVGDLINTAGNETSASYFTACTIDQLPPPLLTDPHDIPCCAFEPIRVMSNTAPKSYTSTAIGSVVSPISSNSLVSVLPHSSSVGGNSHSRSTPLVFSNVDLLPLRPFMPMPTAQEFGSMPGCRSEQLTATGCSSTAADVLIDPLANAAAINGYLSGENVDDDIDQIDFTIRMPSIDDRMYEYTASSMSMPMPPRPPWIQTFMTSVGEQQ